MKMRTFAGLVGLLLAILLVISCSMPQGPAGLSSQSPVDETTLLTVETDAARGRGIYVNEAGQRQDIQSFEDNEDRTVSCVQAIAILPMSPVVAARGMGRQAPDVKAVIIGLRDDGRPGVWAVNVDDSIHPLFLKESGRSCSLLPESEARGGGMRGLFGWNYTPIAARSDGNGDLLIVGEALNEKGIDLGPWFIEADTRVGIYWKLIRHHRRGFYHVSSARVIGTPPESPWSGYGNRGRHHHGYTYGFYGHFLSSLRLFFLSYYEAYLVDLNVAPDDPDNLEEFRWDNDAGLYIVRGIDQDGDPALASISPDETIVISKEEPTGGQADLVATGLDLSLDIDRAAAAVRWILQTTVVNSGSAASPECSIAYYLSADDQLDPAADTLISSTGPEFTLPALAVGEDTQHTLMVDPVTDAGYAYILMQADAGGTVAEENETNNTAALKIRFPRIVIESFRPQEYGATVDTDLELRDQNGTEIASYSNSSFAFIDYQGGLSAGLYYIRVNSSTDSIGEYAVRVITEDKTTVPYPPYFSVPSDDYEVDDPSSDSFPLDGDPVVITLGSDNSVGRRLDAAGDVDWLELQLTPTD
jgi:hypothetical protein